MVALFTVGILVAFLIVEAIHYEVKKRRQD